MSEIGSINTPPTLGNLGYYCSLQVSESKMLKIGINSTRRARWTARLGLVNLHYPLSLSLYSLFPEGGLVPTIEVIKLASMLVLMLL